MIKFMLSCCFLIGLAAVYSQGNAKRFEAGSIAFVGAVIALGFRGMMEK